LTGWESIVLEGNAIELDSTRSPFLNHFNTADERKSVIGEKSLLITDQVPFRRKVFQKLSSTPFVKLPDGIYTLTAKIKSSTGLTELEMYGISDGTRASVKVTSESKEWKTIKINDIKVMKGSLEIGFMAQGGPKAFCQVDDVSVVKNP